MEQAEALKGARARERMTQQMLADAAGVNARTVMRAEAGERVSHENVRALCSVLKLDASKLDVPDGGGGGDEAEAVRSPSAAVPRQEPRIVYVESPSKPTSPFAYAAVMGLIMCGMILSFAALTASTKSGRTDPVVIQRLNTLLSE